jgi:hypothetical protein
MAPCLFSLVSVLFSTYTRIVISKEEEEEKEKNRRTLSLNLYIINDRILLLFSLSHHLKIINVIREKKTNRNKKKEGYFNRKIIEKMSRSVLSMKYLNTLISITITSSTDKICR